MAKVAVMMADGFEEIEALSVVDILRRADVDVSMVSLNNSLEVQGAHGVGLKADITFDEYEFKNADMIVLPGGLPGAEHLAKSHKLGQKLKEAKADNKKLAAICAAPWALSSAEVLGSEYTCYPGFEATVNHAGYNPNKNVVVDGNIITSRGPATAMEFALELVKELCGEQKYSQIKSGLLF